MPALVSPVARLARTAFVILAVAGATLSALPAQAESLNFQLGIGSDGKIMSFGLGTNDYKKNYRPLKRCLKDWQVEAALEDYGFRHPRVVDHYKRNQVAAIGDWRGRSYDMMVDACSGKVYDVQRRTKGTGGFGFQFRYDGK
jgi:hypothetical protein